MYYEKENPHGGALDKRILDFSSSVNPLGPPESVIKVARESLEGIGRYPDPHAAELIEAISGFEGLPKDYILCGNGASEIIYSYCSAIGVKHGLEIAPTFSEYEAAVTAFGGEMKRYLCSAEDGFTLCEDFISSLKENEGTPVDTLFICNPNNPTGRLFSKDSIKGILDGCREKGIRVFIDECFMDLSSGDWSSKEFLMDYPNIFLLKAFTKTFAMAGLRLGYGLTSDKNLLRKMSEISPPWNISAVAQAAGVEALKELGYIKKAKELIRIEREYLLKELKALGLEPVPSEANFILFFSPQEVAANGIAIRDCSNFYGLGQGWYRIAVKRREENIKLIEALK